MSLYGKGAVLLMMAAIFLTYSPLSSAEILIDSAGNQYISNQMIIGIAKECPKLAYGEFSVAGYSPGVQSLDKLCARYGMLKVEPWFTGKLRDGMHLKDVVERMYIFTTDGRYDIRDIKAAFSRDSHLEYAELYDVPIPYYNPNDPNIGQQWFLPQINAFEAWDVIRGDTTKAVIVGISDTGVYYDHPDLEPNMWVNEPEDINHNGVFDNFDVNQGGDLDYVDDDDNGYVDDVIGYDLGVGDPDPSEESPTHGTHVAGCASEATDNGIGGAGIGFSARIIAAKGANSGGALTAVYQAIVYSVANGADFCNCSWGSYSYYQPYQNIITNAFNDGCLVIAAAANDNTINPSYPAGYENCMAVAATGPNDSRASFSNYGDWVDIASPGVNIRSTWAHDQYTNLDGTSMASPIVSGTACLIKAQNLFRQPQDVWDILVSTADSLSLYQANPTYVGMLGSGRVDAYAALAAASMPNIQYISSSIEITNDDGDGVLNPGENINLVVTLKNLWADANNVAATISGDASMTITDDSSTYGLMRNGEEISNTSDPFKLEIHSDAPIYVADLTMNVTADGGYSSSFTFPLEISLNQKNFPYTAGGNIEGHMAMVSLDHLYGMEVVFGAADDKVYALSGDGTPIPGFPVSVSGAIVNGIAAGQVTGDWRLDLVAATKTGNLYVIHHDGQIASGFPIAAGGQYYATPTLYDIDGDNLAEMFFPAFGDGKLYAYHGDGSAVAGFPVATPNKFYGSAAVGDIDGDGQMEIVAGSLDGNLYAWNHDGTPATGFPVNLGSQIWVSPAIGDIDGDAQMEIVVGTQGNTFFALNGDGSEVFQVDVGATIKSDAALAEVDGSDGLEIFVGTNSHKIYGLNGDGSSINGFPVDVGNSINGSPVIVDIDSDGQKEVFAAATDGIIYGFNMDGTAVRNFPIPTYGTLTTSSLAVGDIDGDNDLELAVGLRQASDNVVVIDCKDDASVNGFDWAMYGHDVSRTHRWFDFMLNVSEDGQGLIPSELALMQNYPNPFNPITRISFDLPEPSYVKLALYNLKGQEIIKLVDGNQKAGRYELSWNGMNADGNTVSSGVYFYRLEAGGQIAIRKMVLIK
ncbi:MAG: hypothetical protein CO189_05695 [candidate division Zixibacteria bacterium CG_4_9_14_3_um_filter_46_8]|nr:MAG: hypothetical protein CO189_05695 [candidate division Zixibacteria bacterium CG_4_9_14_3_um_filter_46_8]